MKYLKSIEKFSSGINLTSESFDMRRDNCDRCGQPTNNVTIMSIFNEDVICLKCKEEEKKDPEYQLAVEAEKESIIRNDRNFKGIMPNYKPIKRN